MFTLTDGIATFKGNARAPILNTLKENCEEIGENIFKVDHLTLTSKGCEFPGKKINLLFYPAKWIEFSKLKLPSNFSARGKKAADVLADYAAWIINNDATLAISALKKGDTTLKDIEQQAPYLKNHPLIQKMKAKFKNKAPVRRGPRQVGIKQPIEVQELIAWVDFYRETFSISIEKAADIALNKHSILTPKTWTEPQETLARAYKRYKKYRGETERNTKIIKEFLSKK